MNDVTFGRSLLSGVRYVRILSFVCKCKEMSMIQLNILEYRGFLQGDILTSTIFPRNFLRSVFEAFCDVKFVVIFFKLNKNVTVRCYCVGRNCAKSCERRSSKSIEGRSLLSGVHYVRILNFVSYQTLAHFCVWFSKNKEPDTGLCLGVGVQHLLIVRFLFEFRTEVNPIYSRQRL